MTPLFRAGRLRVRAHSAPDFPAILEVYRQCEDFLSLGPVATASGLMVAADLAHAAATNGSFCVIEDPGGAIVGILEFSVDRAARTAVLDLLMICRPHRNKGCGTVVFRALESYLVERYGVRTIDSGVQVNNPRAIRFWKRCGFTIDTAPRHHADGTTAFDMRKELQGGEGYLPAGLP